MLTENQVALARHAIGLPNHWGGTYRNCFCVGRGDSDYGEWLRMVDAGAAVRRDGARLPFGGSDLFHMTYAGAQIALEPHEYLRDEDFPDSPSHGRKDI